jgi:hypothetical protein
MKRVNEILNHVSLQDFVDGHLAHCTKQNVIEITNKLNVFFEVITYDDRYEVNFYDSDLDDDNCQLITTKTLQK